MAHGYGMIGASLINKEHMSLVDEMLCQAKERGLVLVHWKSNIRLPDSVVGKTDLDLSIPPDQEEQFKEVLIDVGFLPFLSPIWSRYSGVSDWLGYDEGSNSLLHVHLHNRLLTGAKTVKEQSLPWLELMNSSLQIDSDTGISVPDPAFEYHLLLAREGVKSYSLRGFFMRVRGFKGLDELTCSELEWLWTHTKIQDVDAWGEKLWTKDCWSRVREYAFFPQVCRDDTQYRLLAREIYIALSPWRKGGVISNYFRFLFMRLWMTLVVYKERVLRGSRPGKRLIADRAPIIAFVGSDGAGKSTVTADVECWLGKKADVVTLYFGSNTRWYKRLRSILKWRLGVATKPSTVSFSPRSSSRFPIKEAIKGVLHARTRLRQQRRALRMAQRGSIVLADRWPQNEFHGLCDGPVIQDPDEGNWLIRWLRVYEINICRRLTKLHPDLIVKLNVPYEIALKRKPDHSPDMLASKVDVIGKLKFGGAPIVEVDASLPLDDVVRISREYVWGSIRKSWSNENAVH